MSTIAVVVNIRFVLSLIVLALLGKALKNAATLYLTAPLCSTTPTGNILEAAELRTPRYKGPMVSGIEGLYCNYSQDLG